MKGCGAMEPEMKQFYESLDSEEKEFYEAEACICDDGREHIDGCDCYHLDRNSVRYLDKRLYDSITHDWKDVFVRVLKHIARLHGGVDALTLERYPLCSIFINDAVDCLEAVMNGETAGILEINDVNALPSCGKSKLRVPILHKAASYAAIRITNFYLPGNEAQLNLRIHDDGGMGSRPLDFAIQRYVRSIERIYNLKSRECISEWISEACLNEPMLLAIKILFRCSYVYKFDGAEIVTLLASKTLEIEQDFFNYLKERKLVESIILLMLAHDSLMPRIERGSKIRDLVRQEMTVPKTPIFRSASNIDRLSMKSRRGRWRWKH